MISLDMARELQRSVMSVVDSYDFMAMCDLVGSTTICGEGEDADILVCCTSPEKRIELEQILQTSFFYEIEGSEEYPQDEFTSLRNTKNPVLNILICDDSKFFESWQRAVNACRAVFLATGSCNRELRVAIHQAVMD